MGVVARVTKSWRFWHRTNLAEHSSAINTKRERRGSFEIGAGRFFCKGAANFLLGCGEIFLGAGKVPRKGGRGSKGLK